MVDVIPFPSAPGPAATLSAWVVTENPTDFPGKFVAREFQIGAGFMRATANHRVASTLEEIRSLIPPGLFRLARQQGDDAVVVETWL